MTAGQRVSGGGDAATRTSRVRSIYIGANWRNYQTGESVNKRARASSASLPDKTCRGA